MMGDFFQALANPCRREIIKLLSRKSLNVKEIAAYFDISQPCISRHLDILKQAGIITSERKAMQIIYSLNLSAIDTIFMQLSNLFQPGSDSVDE